MCLGLPMRVVESDGFTATVEGLGERRKVSLLLVGDLPKGTPVLVNAGNALRVLEEAEVPLIEQALTGLNAALNGESLDGYFDDLEREPQLPPHLRTGETR